MKKNKFVELSYIWKNRYNLKKLSGFLNYYSYTPKELCYKKPKDSVYIMINLDIGLKFTKAELQNIEFKRTRTKSDLKNHFIYANEWVVVEGNYILKIIQILDEERINEHWKSI